MLGMPVCIHNVWMNMYVWLWAEFMGRTREDPEAGVWEVWTEVWGAHQSEQYSPSANGKGLLIYNLRNTIYYSLQNLQGSIFSIRYLSFILSK